MRHQLRRFRGWLLSFIPVLSLACTDTTVPQEEPEVQRSCTAGRCMTCYIYTTDTECVKD